MVIVDEVSLGGAQIPQDVIRNLNILKEKTSVLGQARNGNIAVLWGGDMGQLPPPFKGGKMLYMTNTPEWDDFMNCFVELKGNHRFKTIQSLSLIHI